MAIIPVTVAHGGNGGPKLFADSIKGITDSLPAGGKKYTAKRDPYFPSNPGGRKTDTKKK